jgi:hypothetical protein
MFCCHRGWIQGGGRRPPFNSYNKLLYSMHKMGVIFLNGCGPHIRPLFLDLTLCMLTLPLRAPVTGGMLVFCGLNCFSIRCMVCKSSQPTRSFSSTQPPSGALAVLEALQPLGLQIPGLPGTIGDVSRSLAGHTPC